MRHLVGKLVIGEIPVESQDLGLAGTGDAEHLEKDIPRVSFVALRAAGRISLEKLLATGTVGT